MRTDNARKDACFCCHFTRTPSPKYVPVISRTVDFNLPRLLETTGECPFQKGPNLSHNLYLYFKVI